VSRSFLLFIALLSFALVVASSGADTFQLTDGTTQTGTVASFDQNGLSLRIDPDNYTRIEWGKLSQDDLKRLAQNPKIAGLVEPFIDEPPPQTQQPLDLKKVNRLDRPGKISLIGAMFSSSVGLMVLLLVYIANIYAGYEIARFRQREPGLVCGVSAVLPVIGPSIFLWMPSFVKEPEYVAPEVTASQQQTFTVTTPPVANAAPSYAAPQASRAEAASEAPESPQPVAPGGLHLAPSAHDQTSAIPAAQTFARGQFMFNRRFFETKFPGFFGMVRHGPDRDMVLSFKTARGEYVGQRIARISANELHLQVAQGDASAEVMIPFNDIKEIQLKHKDA